MLKKSINYLLFAFVISFSSNAIAADTQNKLTPAQQKIEDEKYEIMKRDQVDTTDIFGIQLDDSEVEDEEEINQAEKKEVFKLPQPR